MYKTPLKWALPLFIWASSVSATPQIAQKTIEPELKEPVISHPCARYSVKTLMKRSSPYQEAIDKYAERYKVDPAIIKAVIAIESCYNDRAESPKGAQGLMQLIPETAERFGVTDSFDTTQNIHGGTRYLSWLSKRYQGDLVKVLAAYNAGEGRVDQYDGVPPYQETKHYVHNVLAVYNKLADKNASVLRDLPVLEDQGPTESPAATLIASATPVMRALFQPSTAGQNAPNVSLKKAVFQGAAHSQKVQPPARVQAVYRSPVKPTPPARPTKPGRSGLVTNKARAPHLYKQPGGPTLLELTAEGEVALVN